MRLDRARVSTGNSSADQYKNGSLGTWLEVARHCGRNGTALEVSMPQPSDEFDRLQHRPESVL